MGSILTLIGLAMLITGIVRRSRIKKQAGYTGTSATAGYVAPGSAGTQPPSPALPGPVPHRPNQDPNQPDTDTPWG